MLAATSSGTTESRSVSFAYLSPSSPSSFSLLEVDKRNSLQNIKIKFTINNIGLQLATGAVFPVSSYVTSSYQMLGLLEVANMI